MKYKKPIFANDKELEKLENEITAAVTIGELKGNKYDVLDYICAVKAIKNNPKVMQNPVALQKIIIGLTGSTITNSEQPVFLDDLMWFGSSAQPFLNTFDFGDSSLWYLASLCGLYGIETLPQSLKWIQGLQEIVNLYYKEHTKVFKPKLKRLIRLLDLITLNSPDYNTYQEKVQGLQEKYKDLAVYLRIF